MSWHPFDEGKSIGERGSEFGVIIRDEKRNGAARITLERDTRSASYAIDVLTSDVSIDSITHHADDARY